MLVEEKVEEVVEEVKKVEEVVRIDITDSEKLFVTKTENDFLKAQVEIHQLSQRISQLQEAAKTAQNAFTSKVTELEQKYSVDKTKLQFNMLEQAFTKKS